MKYAALLLAGALVAGCQSPQQPVATNNPAPAPTTAPLQAPDSTAVRALRDYPASLPGHVRYVVMLPALADRAQEQTTQVEILPGKSLEVDCNRHGLAGTLTEKTVEGFGYPYYVFDSDGQVRSTRMGCPDNRRTTQFVTGETQLVRYNSQLPLVVYVPTGMGLKYRLWRAEVLQEAKPQ